MSWLATTPGKYLQIPLRSTIGGVPGGRPAAVLVAALIGRLWCWRGAAPGWRSDASHAIDRPVPIVEFGFGHLLAGRHFHIALGVLDLTDKRAPAAGDFLADGVGLLADLVWHRLAPGVAIDAATHRQDGLRRNPFS